jgi:predicted ester cyclase
LTQFVSMMRSALPDLRITLEDDIAEGDKVVTRWIGQGTHQGELMGIAPTGNRVTITGIPIHRIEDTKIVEEWSNWDAPGLIQQIGAIPSP